MSKNISVIVVVVVVLAGLCYVGYLAISWLILAFARMNPGVGAAIIVGATTVISSVSIASFNARKAKERAAFEAHREKKAEVYNEFMDMFIQLMKNTKAGKEGERVLPKNIEEFFYNFTSKVTVYGGPGVVKAYSSWRAAAVEHEGAKGVLLIDKLFREMRSDLGESNKGIGENELLGLFITGGKTQIAKEADRAISQTRKAPR